MNYSAQLHSDSNTGLFYYAASKLNREQRPTGGGGNKLINSCCNLQDKIFNVLVLNSSECHFNKHIPSL